MPTALMTLLFGFSGARVEAMKFSVSILIDIPQWRINRKELYDEMCEGSAIILSYLIYLISSILSRY